MFLLILEVFYILDIFHKIEDAVSYLLHLLFLFSSNLWFLSHLQIKEMDSRITAVHES